MSRNLYEYHLDFPGNALDPGCDYERWADRLTEGEAPTVYAHVATEADAPGRIALQYWFYYVFNDWNNTHEGDWENIQLIFDAADARQALSREPVSVGYSQHEGSEEALWGEEKLELVDATHPVVHPAAGSHANFFGSALFLGSSAEQGVGCDDTTGPHLEVRPVVRTIPSDPAEARTVFPWIGFEGRWGEFQRAFFNGPTGPNLKTSWTEPITISENWRDRSYAVPAGGALGTSTTDFFCSVIGGGSTALRRLVDEPLPVLLALGALVVLVAFGLSRATWRPTAPLRLARRRAWGQILTAAARMYAGRLRLFLGIGLVLLPISLLVTLLQAVVIRASSIAGVSTEGESGGFLVFLVFVIGTALTLLGLSLVIAATGRALVEIDHGRQIGPFGAYRLAFDSARPLLRAVLIAVTAISLLVELRGARPDCHLAGSPLGACNLRGRARGLLRDRRAEAESSPGSTALAQGRISDGVRNRARSRPRPAHRRSLDRSDERSALGAQPRGGSGQCGDDAVRRAHDRLRVLRRARTARARAGRRAGRASSGVPALRLTLRRRVKARSNTFRS